jgi:hypothetical protein
LYWIIHQIQSIPNYYEPILTHLRIVCIFLIKTNMQTKFKITLALISLTIFNISYAGSRQLGTGGVTQIEGSSGSGLVPWATIAGYAEKTESDFNLAYTFLSTNDYDFDMQAVSYGWANRVELSFAKQTLNLNTLGPALGLGSASLKQDVFGLKVRLAGNMVYTKMPQIALGMQYKKNKDFFIPAVAGAIDDSGTDIYLSASKLFLAQPFGLNGFATLTLRSTKANETGLLGFGGDLNNNRSLVTETSIGVFLNKSTVIGFDFRQKKSNLSFASEDNWRDIFIAYIPNRHVSLVLAYADLGTIATLENQQGFYFSINGSF